MCKSEREREFSAYLEALEVLPEPVGLVHACDSCKVAVVVAVDKHLRNPASGAPRLKLLRVLAERERVRASERVCVCERECVCESVCVCV